MEDGSYLRLSDHKKKIRRKRNKEEIEWKCFFGDATKIDQLVPYWQIVMASDLLHRTQNYSNEMISLKIRIHENNNGKESTL